MQPSRQVVLVALCAVFVVACNRDLELPPVPQFASLNGAIDTGGRVPAGDNQIRLINATNGTRAEQTTDADGGFTFGGLTPGPYLVQADVPGFAPLREGPFAVPSGGAVDLGVFTLAWLGTSQSEGSISGAVVVAGGSAGSNDGGVDAGVDGGSGRPSDAMGATVSLLLERTGGEPAKVAETPVDAFGRFSARVPPGRYTVEATHPWYVAARRNGINLGEGQLLDLGQPLVLELNPADVSGQIDLELETLGGSSTRPGAGVTITSDTGVSATADVSGRYTLPGLAAGTRHLTFTFTNYHDEVAERTITLAAGEHATLPPIRLRLDRGDIAGRVRMSDGSQLDNVSVFIAGSADGGTGSYAVQAVRSSSDPAAGDFVLRGIPVASYNVVAHRTNYVDATSPTVNVRVGSVTPLVDELRLARLQGDFLIEDNDLTNTAGFTRSTDVTLVLSNVTNAAEYRVVEGSQQALATAMWQPFSTPRIPFTLSSGDEAKTVYLQIKNTVGNEGAALSATIVLDTTPPHSGSLLLASGSGYTRIANPIPVTLSALDNGGVAFVRLASAELDGGVELSDAGVPDGGFPELLGPRVPYVRDTNFTRPLSVDGVQPVAAQFIDNAGNVSDIVLASIVVDTVPPTGSLSIVRGTRASVDGYTNSLLVELAETWGTEPNGGFVQVRVANDAMDLLNAQAQPTRARASWFLDAQGEGTKTVHYVFVDAAGNQSGAAQATIIYDATSPLVTATLLSSSPTSSSNVTIGLNTVETSPFAPDAGVTVSESALFTNPQTRTYPSNNQVSWTLTSGDGPRSVFVRVRDAAGNDGTDSVTLELDTTAPAGLAIALVGALADGTPSSTLTAQNTVTVNLTQSGATRLLLGDSTLTACPALDATWRTITGNAVANHPLPGSGATRTVTACFSDSAGNVAGPVSASIAFDNAAPSGCQLALTGLRTNGQPSGNARTALRTVPLSLSNCTETPLEIAVTEQATVSCAANAAGLAWSPYSTTANDVTLSSVDGLKTVRGCVRDAARNTVAFTIASLTLDTTPPSAARVVINGGANYINGASLDAGVAIASVAGTASGATEWAVAEEGTTPSSFVSYTTSNPVSLALSAGDGVKGVRALFRDDLGNTTPAEVADSIEVDTVAPVLSGLSLTGTLADGTPSTTLTTVPDVSATLAQTGASTVFFGGSGLSTCPSTGHSTLVGTSAQVTLTGTGATRTVKACVGDAAGNVSALQTATIGFDTAGPSGCAIVLTGLRADDASPTTGGAAGSTGRRDVRYTLTSCTETPVQIVLTESTVSCSASNTSLIWAIYDSAATNSFSLAGVDGSKTVRGCVRDAARNTQAFTAASIVLDTTPPSGASVELDTGAQYVNATQKAARGNANVASARATVTGATEWALAEGATPSTWRALATNNPFDFTFSTGDGIKTVRALFRDDVGNVTLSEVTDSIEFDTSAPTFTSLLITGALADGTASTVSTVSTNVTATLTHSGGTRVLFGSSAGMSCTGTYSPFSGTTVSTTLGGSGTPRTLAACVSDEAGNTAGPVSDTIDVDTAAPTGCALVMTGRRVDGAATSGGTSELTALRDVGVSLTGCNETVAEIYLTENASVTCTASNNFTWVPYNASTQVSLSAVDGLKTVRGCVRDASGNTLSFTADTITLDTTPPSGASVSIKGGAAWFNYADWLANTPDSNAMSVAGTASGATEWAIAESATPSVFTAFPSTSPSQLTFSAGEGTRTVYALFRDAVGNVTPVGVTDSIDVDLTVPTLTAVSLTGTLADGVPSDVSTVTANVQLGLTHVGGAGYYVGDGTLSACPTSGYTSFAGASASITLPGSGTTRTVRVCISDAAGNVAGYQQDSINLDSAAPTGCALTLVGRRVDGTATSGATADKTALSLVAVSLGSCTETPTEVYLLEAGSVGCSATASLSWQTYTAGATNFALTGGDASKNVVGCVRDAARNVSTLVADAITLDTTAPTAASISLHGGAAYFNRTAWLANTPDSNNMNLTGTATGASEWAYAETGAITSFSAFTSPTTIVFPMSVNDGTKTVRALFRDDVGNTTAAELTDTIEVDTAAPTLNTISISGTLADGTASTSLTTSTAVTVSLNQSGATLVALGDSTFTCPATLAGFSSFNGTTASATLTDPGATRTVQACVADAAGNTSVVRSSTIGFDSAAPSSCVVTLVGRRTDGSSTSGTVPEKTALASISATLTGCSESPTDIYLLETTSPLTCPAAGSAVWVSLSGSLSSSLTLSSGDALKTVKACVRDGARNVSAASFQDTITLDTTPPTGASVSLHSGADYFNRAAWLAQSSANRINVTGTATGATEWAWAEGGTPTTWGAFTSPATVLGTFTAGDGTKKVYALFRDDVGNTTPAESSDSIEVDTVAPTLSAVTLVGTLGDGTTSSTITNSAAVTGNFVQTGGVSYAYGDNTFTCPNGTAFTAFNGSSAAITLPGSGTPRTVRVCVADEAGNPSSYVADTIEFDATTPSGCALVLTGKRVDGVSTTGALTDLTALRDVGVGLSGCADTNVMVALTEAGSVTCNNSVALTWVSLLSSTTFQLSSGDGSKTVRGCVRDQALNVGSITADAISLDTTAPESPEVVLDSTSGYSNSFTRTASGTAVGAYEWAYATSSSGPFNFVSYTGDPTNASVTFPVPDGKKAVFAKFRDALLNTTNAVSATVTVDTTPPTAPVLLTVDGQNRGARLFWDPSSDSSGIAGYELLSDPSGTPITVRSTAAGTATDGFVLNLENRADQTFAVRAIDLAGNRSSLSGVMSTTIGWKRTAVSPGSVYPVRPLDVALKGADVYVTYMETDSNWSGLGGTLWVAVSHDRGSTWSFNALDTTFHGGRQLAPIGFTDSAVWVATVGNPGLTSDITAGEVKIWSSVDRGDNWTEVSAGQLGNTSSYGKVDSLGLMTSGDNMRLTYMLASSTATKQINMVYASSPSATTLQSDYDQSFVFGNAPYQVTNGLRSCSGNFSSLTMWRDRYTGNSPNLRAITHYYAPDLTFDSSAGEGSVDWVTWGSGSGMEVGSFDLACTALSETMQAYVVYDRAQAAAWAVGNNGVILKYDDTSWVTAPSPTPRTINSVQDVWALGTGYSAGGNNYSLILRWNGSSWEEIQYEGNGASLNDSWTYTASYVIAVGTSGTILRWDGSAWSAMTSPVSNSLYGVWGVNSANIWAVGSVGTILRWNGSTWATQTSGTSNYLRAIWGTSTSNIWAVGDSGTILRWNGATWSAVASPTTQSLLSIWGSSASDIWAVGTLGTVIRYNGSTWSTVSNPSGGQVLNEVSGVSASDVWAVGAGGTAMRFNGSSWTLQPTETTANLNSVWWGGSSGGAPANLYGQRKLGSLQPFSGATTLRTDSDRNFSPQVWAGGRNVYVLYRSTAEKLYLGESFNEAQTFSNWTTLESGVNKGMYAVLSGDNSSDVAVAFTDVNAATFTVMIPSVPSFPLSPLAGVSTTSLTWATAPGVDRYQVDSDPDGALPWANVDFTSLTQATVPSPPATMLAPYVQVRSVDSRNMPGNTGEVWQLRPFGDTTLLSNTSTSVQSSNTGGVIAYNEKALVWPPRGSLVGNEFVLYRTADYGATWTTYVPFTVFTTGARAMAGFNGRAALFYEDSSLVNVLRALVFTDYAAVPTVVTVASGVGIDHVAAKTSVDNSGLVVAYTDVTGDLIRVSTTDSNMNFTARTSIPTTAANIIGTVEVAKADFSTGRIVITWREYNTGSDPRSDYIRAAESLNMGATWSAPYNLVTGTSSTTNASASYYIGSTDLAGANNGAYSVLARTTEFNDFWHTPANLYLTITGTDHSSFVSSGSTYINLKIDSETVDNKAFDAYANSDGHYLVYRAETLDGTVSKLRFAYCFSDCHLFSKWDRSLLKVWTSYVKDQGRFVSMTVGQASTGYDPAIYVLYQEAAGTTRSLKVLTRGVHRRTR